MKRRTVLVALGGAVGTAGCTTLAGSGCSADPHDVGMSASAFEPRELTVSTGTTVVWLNTSQRAHTVTAYGDPLPEGADYFASGGYDSERAAREAWRDGGGAIHTCESFEHTFEMPGEYPYFCIPHERAGMVGTVVVE